MIHVNCYALLCEENVTFEIIQLNEMLILKTKCIIDNLKIKINME